MYKDTSEKEGKQRQTFTIGEYMLRWGKYYT